MKRTGDTTAVGEEMIRTIDIADYTPAWAEAFSDDQSRGPVLTIEALTDY